MKKLNITKEQFNRSHYFKNKYGKLEYVSESGRLFKTNKGKVLMFNEGRLANKLNSGELFEKQMPSLGKAIQKFIDSDGIKGQAGTWNIVTDDDGSIKLYEHHGHLVGTIVDGHMKWEDEDGFYVSAKYSEMILNALCDGGLIERDECQRAIEDAYAREGDYEKEYGESRRFNESADQTPEDIIDNIVTLSILERDAESAEAMFQDLKQELSNMGLLSGQIHEDFDDFHDIAIDFAEHHNFNKQFVEQAAVTLKSEIEQALSRGEFGESTKKFVKEARVPEWLNSFEQARDFVDKACEQLEVVAFEGGADVGNPIHKKLLRIQGEMRDVIESV